MHCSWYLLLAGTGLCSGQNMDSSHKSRGFREWILIPWTWKTHKTAKSIGKAPKLQKMGNSRCCCGFFTVSIFIVLHV